MDVEIQVLWDEEAGVWIATGRDIPGLILEDESREKLMKRVRAAVPELMELNGRDRK